MHPSAWPGARHPTVGAGCKTLGRAPRRSVEPGTGGARPRRHPPHDARRRRTRCTRSWCRARRRAGSTRSRRRRRCRDPGSSRVDTGRTVGVLPLRRPVRVDQPSSRLPGRAGRSGLADASRADADRAAVSPLPLPRPVHAPCRPSASSTVVVPALHQPDLDQTQAARAGLLRVAMARRRHHRAAMRSWSR